MAEPTLYPLRFAPIYQYRLWGGRRLADWLTVPLPDDGPVGEAWLLSYRDDHPSRIANGPLRGRTMSELIQQSPEQILGRLFGKYRRFPLLLKFLDVQQMLSVQVHPADAMADLISQGETGKSESWIVLEAGPHSRIYAGLKPGVTSRDLSAVSMQTVDAALASFRPERGQVFLITAGTVHSLGDGVVVFEIQQNSDVTYRLFDWDHIDPKTGKPRALQLKQALGCIDLDQLPIRPITPVIEATGSCKRERLIEDPHFHVWRLQSDAPFSVGAVNEPRVLVCLEGVGSIDHQGAGFDLEKGAVMLLPASVGVCRFRPERSVTLLEIAVPVLP